MKIIPEKDIPDSIESLEAQIMVRRELQQQMVGRVYPSVLEDQICRLARRVSTIKYDEYKSEHIIDV